MKSQKVTKYLAQSRTFLTQAFEELRNGDLPQASEKGWGAAAQIVKAIAQDRSWYHYSHVSLERVVSRLSQETSNSELIDLFDSANSLHINFYENRYSTSFIANRLRRVGRFVNKAEGLLGMRA